MVLSVHPDRAVRDTHMPRLRAEIEDPVNDDNFMVDDTISSLEIKAKFECYMPSLMRFKVPPE